ncbi:MAG: barstar family protein [Flavobacteriales bacterium]|nr:barstar family protein [Flavobacteriales bacterium]
MKKITIDFYDIVSIEGFYEKLQEELSLTNDFGRNLDALYDILTGEIELPLEIDFINLSLEQLEDYEDLIAVFEDAEIDLDSDFTFRYFME